MLPPSSLAFSLLEGVHVGLRAAVERGPSQGARSGSPGPTWVHFLLVMRVLRARRAPGRSLLILPRPRVTFPRFREHLVKPSPSSPRTWPGNSSRVGSDGAADYRTRQCTQRCPVSPHPVCGIADDRCVHASEGRRRSRHRPCPNSCPCGSCWPCCRGWRVGVGTVSRRTGCRDLSDAGALPWVSGSPAPWRGHARSNPQSTGGPLPNRSRGASTGRAPRRGRASPPWSRRGMSPAHTRLGYATWNCRVRVLTAPGHVWPESVVARHFFTGVAQIPSMRMSRAMRFSPIPWARAALRGCSRLTVLGAPQDRHHRPQRMAVGQVQAQGFTSFSTHVSIGSLCHDNTVAQQGLSCCTWS